MEAEWRPESLLVAEKLQKYAADKGARPAHIAQQWVMRNALVTSTIVGPRTMEQWQDYLDALDYVYDSQDETFIDLLVSPGKTSTLAPSDPHHPIEGRVLAGIAARLSRFDCCADYASSVAISITKR